MCVLFHAEGTAKASTLEEVWMDGGLGPTWSQQDKARVAELLVNLQELLGCGVGSDFILCAQLVTQCLHLSKQFLRAGSTAQPGPSPTNTLYLGGR